MHPFSSWLSMCGLGPERLPRAFVAPTQVSRELGKHSVGHEAGSLAGMLRNLLVHRGSQASASQPST